MPEAFARQVRGKQTSAELQPLYEILQRYDGELICQYDAFAGYCAEAEAKGEQDYPLYKWTKATIDDPIKKAKYVKVFTVYVGGDEVYAKTAAYGLKTDLDPMVGGPIVEKLALYDSNPANNPQPPKKYRT